MTDGAPRRRRAASPYSRTGLFPWGNTYEVPVRRHREQWVSQTPCHLRTVRLDDEVTSTRQAVHCSACGRLWNVRVAPERTPPVALWTA